MDIAPFIYIYIGMKCVCIYIYPQGPHLSNECVNIHIYMYVYIYIYVCVYICITRGPPCDDVCVYTYNYIHPGAHT